jgi:tether containing UBX domain for GLUT4
MATNVVVIASDLRRATIKVTPGTYLIDVLEEACRRLNLSSDKYLVKHRQKTVDLSIPFRASGLGPGAKLELVQKSKTPSAIQVALQVPHPEASEIPGGRLIQKFPSDLTIWKVLRQFESGEASNGKNINITARGVACMENGSGSGSGQLHYETPVLNIMGRELSSFTDFQKTLFDAMTEISQFFNDTDEEYQKEEVPTTETEPVPTGEEIEKQEEHAPQETTESKMEDVQPEPSQEATSVQQEKGLETVTEDNMEVDSSQPNDPLAPVNVFLAPSGSTPAAALAPAPDTDFAPTIAHAQLHQARLQENSRNKRLLSDKELEEKAAVEAAKINAIKSILVKVRFPDNTSSDWQVSPSHTGRFLYDAVRHVMAHNDQPFHLVLPGTKIVIKDDLSSNNGLIKAYKMSGRTLINLVWDDTVPKAVRKEAFLKANVAQQGQQVKVPEPVTPNEKDEEESVARPAPAEKDEGSGDKVAKKIPKWLKLGKK